MFNDDAVVPKGDHPGDGLIEHMRQHDVIKTADWVFDPEHERASGGWPIARKPGGGVNGGRIVVEGTPETVAECPASATGQYLKPLLERASVKPQVVEVKPKKPARSRRVTIDEDEPDLIAAK